ncbi:ABC transporter ATP-binding protein, partial [Candidatus Parcubacteria bacterium]|nr:ABC transporter ATP-binding protein [Candidatus Parcubacteria bacterium]
MIELQNICKSYKNALGETPVLKDISFKIKAGEFLAIMGPSGSGKSTLMHILGCLDTATKGKYFLNNKDISSLSENNLAEIRKKEIGFVFQSFNLLPRANALRNVELPLIYNNIPKEARGELAKQALLSAGLPEEWFSHFSNQLSGGQMQRVAIARALVNNPSIILADEPTGNLDTKTGEIVLDTFQKLNSEEKRTIILITHEPYVAKHADRIIHLVDGVVVSDEQNKEKLFI